ncbi:hypothetical protein MicloDRAFT_00064950 [Microvirga lotononidis]|uniref:Uncharacterized protein n=1 Tax=Microvirga lotononidis TaxID=864069 RepID=I4YP76_9HYPH|nr:hypothetical protein MicloDRAFT_00064950 [Microvirga lotononidis]
MDKPDATDERDLAKVVSLPPKLSEVLKDIDPKAVFKLRAEVLVTANSVFVVSECYNSGNGARAKLTVEQFEALAEALHVVPQRGAALSFDGTDWIMGRDTIK